MTDNETTTEQLTEIEGQAESTPPDGWQLVPLNEPLKGGDEYHAGSDRYIRRIKPEPESQPVQVREGRWRTRGGDIRNVTPTPEGDRRKELYPWWDAQLLGTWTANGRYYSDLEDSPLDLIRYLGPIEPDKTQELPDKTQELPEYTPPDGWRVVRFGEQLLSGDVWVNEDGTEQRSNILQWDASAVSGGRCIRRIGPQPEPEAQPQREPQPEPQQYTPPDGWRVLAVGEVLQDGDMWVWPTVDQLRQTVHVGAVVGANQLYIRRIKPEPESQPVQVREGRWRTRNGLVKSVTAMPTDHEDFAAAYPWWDGVSTWRNDGRWLAGGSTMDLVEYLGPIEQQPETEPAVQGGLVRDVTHLLEESGVLDSAKAEQQIEELRSEVSYVQRLLGESRQRVTQLEELVASLRTINVAQEKAFTAAGKANTDLQHRLNVVAAEWAEQAETIRRLQTELDAAQQVPQAIADRFEEGWNQGTARAVETVLEWLEPVRLVDSPNLANETLQHLPQIMRHLTGLTQD